MKGKSSPMSFYTKLSYAHRFNYQCSEMSSANEIEGIYKTAIERQEMFARAGMADEICCVFLDEAGTLCRFSDRRFASCVCEQPTPPHSTPCPWRPASPIPGYLHA